MAFPGHKQGVQTHEVYVIKCTQCLKPINAALLNPLVIAKHTVTGD